jgi:hypothetical protein
MDDITFDTPAEMISKCIVCDDNENDTDTKLYKLKCQYRPRPKYNKVGGDANINVYLCKKHYDAIDDEVGNFRGWDWWDMVDGFTSIIKEKLGESQIYWSPKNELFKNKAN